MPWSFLCLTVIESYFCIKEPIQKHAGPEKQENDHQRKHVIDIETNSPDLSHNRVELNEGRTIRAFATWFFCQ